MCEIEDILVEKSVVMSDAQLLVSTLALGILTFGSSLPHTANNKHSFSTQKSKANIVQQKMVHDNWHIVAYSTTEIKQLCPYFKLPHVNHLEHTCTDIQIHCTGTCFKHIV